MRGLDRRVNALEAELPTERYRFCLEELSDFELERLEAIVIAHEAGKPIEAMCDADRHLVASLRKVRVQ